MTELQLPGALIDISHEWLAGTSARWSGDLKTWRFPGRGKAGSGGASLTFGYLADLGDLGRYAGSSYSFLGFDELARFTERQYLSMFRVLRQPTQARGESVAAPDGTRLSDVPLRVRSASNPGGPGHAWVKSRFVDPASRPAGVLFLPARLTDNPFLNRDEYLKSLAELPPSERERLLHGDWEIPDEGELFQRSWFDVVDRSELPRHTRAVRFWDLAGTEPGPANPDPDFTLGLRLDLDEQSGVFFVSDLVRVRKPPGAVERLVAETAEADGPAVRIELEQEPGAAGVALADRYRRHVLRGFSVYARRATGPKEVRARPVAAAAENGLIRIVRGANLLEFLEEVCAFPNAPHDDCVDALAGAHKALARASGPAHISVPRGRLPGVSPGGILDRRESQWLTSGRRLPTQIDPIEALAAQLGLPITDSKGKRGCR